MGTVELRKKWIQSIAIVDEQFLRLVDDLYKAYKNKPDFFDELPNEIQDLLIESREDIKNGNFFTHEEVMKSIRKKYAIPK